uniref:Metalloendopeptidase n=1 Tax=Parascaris univalens TaxID=6257 RepID=A0A914ZNR2_PARUN
MKAMDLASSFALLLSVLDVTYGIAGLVDNLVTQKRHYESAPLQGGNNRRYLTPEDFMLAAKTPVKRPTDEEIDAIQNAQLFEGDIEGIQNAEMAFMHDHLDGLFGDVFRLPYHSSLNLATYPDKLWPDGIIPYVLEERLTSEERAAIAQAFDEYKQKTCIRFVPKLSHHDDYVYVKTNSAFGCSSYVGRSGGNQTVSLETGKCFTKGIIAHELMHAIGFFHEHSRTDRDNFVEIKEENIRPGMLRNFEKYPRKIIDPLDMPYDYDSVMHYHKLAFSKNGKPTILPRDGMAQIGQRYKLSVVDAQKINKLYNCNEFSTSTTRNAVTATTQRSSQTFTSTQTTISIDKTTMSTTTASRVTDGTSTSGTTSDLRTTQPKVCEDLNAHCAIWEQLGHCEHSRKYMTHYCRKACGICSVEQVAQTTIRPTSRQRCLDKNLFCGYWAKIGECKSESKFMKIFCKRSCGLCEPHTHYRR